MRKLFGFLIGLVVMCGVFASIYLAGALYDTSDKVKIEPYFFRTGLRATEQVGNPKALSEVQHRKLRDWLVQKYVREYLYVEPNESNIESRMTSYGMYSPLSYMSSVNVFEKWRRDVAPKIREDASKGIRRTVYVFDEVLKQEHSDYLQVDYETKTWYKPNDMTEVPTVKRGTMYLNIENPDEPIQVKQPIEEVQEALHDGIDPAVVFTFYVNDVIIDEK